MPSQPVLSVDSVKYQYPNGFHALKDISFKLQAGESFALLGANGAGKTTLINLIAQLHPMQSGRIEVGGHDVVSSSVQAKLGLGIVPQEFNFNIFQ